MLKLDKQKYLNILQKNGLSAALSQLHADYRDWEFSSFEGDKGYQPEMWRALDEVRDFSRELWDRLSEPSKQ